MNQSRIIREKETREGNMAQLGSMVRVHYIGTFDDGVEFDNSYTRGEPVEFILGAQMMIPGFDKAVLGMMVGDQIEVRLEPEEAYGIYRADLVQVVPLTQVPNCDSLPVGQYITINESGVDYRVLVEKVEDGLVTLNPNHPLAGRALNFSIELIYEQIIQTPGKTPGEAAGEAGGSDAGEASGEMAE
ncbi:MAG: peptidylprolyl isomerase [Coriobacteriales bacterium]|nr:peptidylprolyl isomerase [Coriobacteriales bacterium]